MRRKMKCELSIVLRAGTVCRTDSLHPPTHSVAASVFRDVIKGTRHDTADISNKDGATSAAVGHTPLVLAAITELL
jgi:hypothetical protein